jgi:hypothetical protein
MEAIHYWRERALRAEAMVAAMKETSAGRLALVRWLEEERQRERPTPPTPAATPRLPDGPPPDLHGHTANS